MKLQISIDDQAYEVDVEVPEERNARYLSGYIPPYAPTSRVTVPPIAPTTPSAGPGTPTDGVAVGDRACRSPMAGVVVKVNVQVGQQLQEHDLLMVLEAMKMETNITAARSGKVKAIHVAAGDAVTVDQMLLEYE